MKSSQSYQHKVTRLSAIIMMLCIMIQGIIQIGLQVAHREVQMEIENEVLRGVMVSQDQYEELMRDKWQHWVRPKVHLKKPLVEWLERVDLFPTKQHQKKKAIKNRFHYKTFHQKVYPLVWRGGVKEGKSWVTGQFEYQGETVFAKSGDKIGPIKVIRFDLEAVVVYKEGKEKRLYLNEQQKDGLASAVIIDLRTSKEHTVYPKDKIDGYTVKAIDKNGLILEKEGQSRYIRREDVEETV